MMTVVALVRLMPNPPALVEIKKTWYATARVSACGRGRPKSSYAISLVGTGGTVTTCRAGEGDVTYQPDIKVSPRPIRRSIQPGVGDFSKPHEIFQQVEHTGNACEKPITVA
jgi:hypothetical protein